MTYPARRRATGQETGASRLPTGRRFAGRVCVVTGGGRGIGRSVALALASEGGAVGVASRSIDQCRSVVSEIKAAGGRALPLKMDVTVLLDCERGVEELAEILGKPSVLVHAAGISPVRQRAELHDVQAWHHIVDTNLNGAYLVSRAMAPHVLRDGGSLVMVSSVMGEASSPRLAAYGASKAGVTQLVRTLAQEWGDRGVRINAVCPGYVRTQMTEELLNVDHLRSEIVHATPMQRLGTIEEVVSPILFLASDEASYITGTSLVVDGGMVA